MLIEIKSLTKKYNSFVAADHINLSIKSGEIFGLLGPNGAGKTTTLMMLSTLLKPTTGTAIVNGFDIIKEPSQVRKSIGMVFQEPSSDELLTGYENLKLHTMMFGVPANLREQRIKEGLELVGLTAEKNQLVKKYSGGMRRRLELARGLSHHPKIIFLDEPTLGLDPNAREQIWAYIKKLVKKENVTIIITTHYMDEADRLCDRIAIIDRGKIVAIDSPENLKRKIGGDIIQLKFKGERNLNSLKKLKFVKKIDKFENGAALTVSDASKHLQEILKVIGTVESVEMRTPTLNDVFLHYTGKEYHQNGESPEGGFFEKAMTYRARSK